jgi:V-type H+-transporting ATPase subunit a
VEEATETDVESPLLEEQGTSGSTALRGLMKLGFVTGVVERDRMATFERILWRVTRGNLYIKHAEIDEKIADPKTGELKDKEVFIIFFQGERSETKIRKICESFNANLYPCPESGQERNEMLSQVEARIDDLETVINKSVEQKRHILEDIAQNLEEWKVRVFKEKSIYHVMNLCNYDVGRKCLIAEGWCPADSIEQIQEALKRAEQKSNASVTSIVNRVRTKESPPTYFKTNRFTQPFQGIVDAYGMARYKEVNPGVFTIITFPFLFGMMFGDVGHGLLMFLFALWLCLKEDTLSKVKLNEMVQTCFSGRYLLLMMSLFSIYCGALYNEVFAVPLDIFGSRWEYYSDEEFARDTNPSIAYPFGIDPAWKGAKNELTFYNSIKMKLSVIFGVTQMVFGIILSLFNGLYFKKPYNIAFEFAPQLLFMLAIFGYMCVLIIIKWCTDWSDVHAHPYGPPGLLNLMINMFLKPYELQNGDDLFTGQLYIQWALILTAVISIPTMLFPKPFLLRRDHKKRLNYQRINTHDEDSDEEEEEEEFDFGEVFIHQIIHTIEFVLGSISNTASYLRLWALSLAHSELATVFWTRVFVATLDKNNAIVIFGGWAVWAAFTFAVLSVMEALSAFLHALRLHWVEFQNKFYMGDGYKFVPFSYARLLSGEDEN